MSKPTLVFTLHCAICDQPVDLRTCNTDADGKAIHGECLDGVLFRRKPPSSEHCEYRVLRCVSNTRDRETSQLNQQETGTEWRKTVLHILPSVTE